MSIFQHVIMISYCWLRLIELQQYGLKDSGLTGDQSLDHHHAPSKYWLGIFSAKWITRL